MSFFEDLQKEKNIDLKKIAMFYDDSDFGVSSYEAVKEAAEKHGYRVSTAVKFPFGSVDLDSEVSILKKEQPDFILGSVMISDLILFIKTAKKLDYNIPGMAGFGGGFAEPELVETMGRDAEYFMTRDVFSLDLIDKLPLLGKINKLYKEKSGYDFEGRF